MNESKYPRPVQPTSYVRRPNKKRFTVSNGMLYGLLGLFLAVALVTAYLTFVVVRSVFASQAVAQPTEPVVVDPNQPPAVAISPKDINKPLQQDDGPVAAAWDGKSRVTILFMGLDYRDWEAGGGPSRTDTMILMTLDPETRTAGILSIPRDLWVNVPGYDYNKINTAYFLGEAYHEPGGGPGLAMRTVEEFLGIKIDYYAQVDFVAFEKLIDELGGIEVEVPEEIVIDPIGPGNTVTLEPGLQKLDGSVALAYARSRNTAGNDFDRAARQQQVIMAVRERILDLNMLPNLIKKSPILYQQLASGVHSNLSLGDIIKMAWIAQQVQPDNIQRAVIGVDQVTEDYSWDGQQILRPNTDEIRKMVEDMFTTTQHAAPLAPTTVSGDPKELMTAENARVSVLNGTYTPGLAGKTRELLIANGVNVTVADNAQEKYTNTTIIDYSGKPYTLQFLTNLLGPAQVYSSYDPNSPVDIAIILGDDWDSNQNKVIK